MAFTVNRVQLGGNLTRDPELRFFGNQRAVVNFGIAINRRYRTADGEQREETTFVDCEAWGRTAELIGQYLTKGSRCYLEGRLKLDQWEDREGQRRSKIKVSVDNVQFLDGPRQGQGQGQGQGGDRNQRSSGGGGYSNSNSNSGGGNDQNDNNDFNNDAAPVDTIEDEPPF